jgi:hypothetical protein
VPDVLLLVAIEPADPVENEFINDLDVYFLDFLFIYSS